MGKQWGTMHDGGTSEGEYEQLQRENLELRFQNLRLLQQIEEIRKMKLHHADGSKVVFTITYEMPEGPL